jgi:anti-anti-sigma factor
MTSESPERLLALTLEQGPITIGQLAGEIDLSNVEDVQLQLLDGVPNDALGLVLDVSRVTYLDSAALRLLFDLSERLRWRGQWLRLVAPAESPLRRLLAITKLDTLVPVVETVEAARESSST